MLRGPCFFLIGQKVVTSSILSLAGRERRGIQIKSALREVSGSFFPSNLSCAYSELNTLLLQKMLNYDRTEHLSRLISTRDMYSRVSRIL